ncbi:hypothetical protein PUR71_08570 [Streptomyces sp. SP17BM10]|uniref:hypothetical protein n=1 Tax=Streptomyces sp. SP17BM10 TaxID=3002530 RepID=UPI002E77F439|nr:hypothetical protein [Streptomyces sp. SP17BM10]MEE1782968.1 hypothetical protein [Streptomyces sp. SP17BM10]
MSENDFVNRLLGAGGADGPPVRPLIGSLFEPRRRMQVGLPPTEPSPLAAESADSSPPAVGHELPAAESPGLLPPSPEPAELPPPAGRAPEPPQAVRTEPPTGPGRPAEPAVALPKPRRADASPEEPTGRTVPEEEHAASAEPPAEDVPTAPVPDPVRAHPVPASIVDPLLVPRRERASAAPDVRITIGRVEVRAGHQPPTPQPPRRIPGRRPAMSLEDYLRTRAGGGGAR